MILAGSFAVHRSALEHEFVSWDDDINFYENPNLITGEIRWTLHLIEPYQGLWMPVTYSAASAIAAATREQVEPDHFRLDPAPYHAASLLLHLATTALVFFLLRFWITTPTAKRRALAAAIGALFFSIHPIQVEAVHWATSLKDTLSVFFGIASLACVPVAPKRFTWRLVLAWLLLALALAAKPAVVVVPVVWLLFSIARSGRPGRWGWLHFAVQLALAIIVAILARSAQPAETEDPLGLMQRAWVSIDSLGFYVTQILVPTAFCPDYGRTPEFVLEQGVTPVLLAGCAILAFILVMVLRKRWSNALILLALPAALGPVLGVVPFSHQSISTVTDRYAYLAMLIPAFFAARILSLPRVGRAWPVAVGLVVACGLSSARAGNHWQDTDSLWRNVLRVNPNSASAWTNLGYQHERAGRSDEAMEHYERAIAASPRSALAYNNIGNIHFRANRIDEAFRAYGRAHKANPKDLHARNNLGVIHHRRGELEEAEALFQTVIDINPNFAPAHHNRGLVAMELDEFGVAERHFAEALRVDPGYAQARRGLAKVLATRGMVVQARAELSRACGIAEGQAEFELRWAALLQGAGGGLDEVREARYRAYELGWREAEFLAQLGVGLLLSDQPGRAETVLREAVELGTTSLQPRLELARLDREADRWEESRELLIETVRDYSFEPEPWHNLALYHQHHGDSDKAKDAVQTALRLNPNFAPSLELAAELELAELPE